MLEMYGVSDYEQRQVLVDMAREGHRKGWWAAYDDVLRAGSTSTSGLRRRRPQYEIEISVVHGLLQIPDYARAVLREMFPRHAVEQIDRLVDLRIERQRRLDDDPPLELWAILDEAVIRQPWRHAVMCADSSTCSRWRSNPANGADPPRSPAARTRGTAGVTILEFPNRSDSEVSYIWSVRRGVVPWRRAGMSGSAPRPSTGCGRRRWPPAHPDMIAQAARELR